MPATARPNAFRLALTRAALLVCALAAGGCSATSPSATNDGGSPHSGTTHNETFGERDHSEASPRSALPPHASVTAPAHAAASTGQGTRHLPSPVAVAEAVLDALQREDLAALHAVRVDRSTYSEVLWPGFPQYDPGRPGDWDFYWTMHQMNSLGGAGNVLTDFGGMDLELLEILPHEITSHPGYTMWRRCSLRVRDRATGEVQVIRAFGSLVGIDGRWQVLGYPN